MQAVTDRKNPGADVCAALISRHCYKPPYSHKKAAAIIRKGNSSLSDPTVIAAFSARTDEFKDICSRYSDEE
jgi:response regulator RpfG family c-di-GMP phosphodiesterase